jgi:hypothetical protein
VNVGIGSSNVTGSNEPVFQNGPANHSGIFRDINICDYVDNHGVKEVWIWMYHYGRTWPIESYQIGPVVGLGNGYMENIPVCQHTYTAFDYNFDRGVDMALEDHTHHLESLFNYVDSAIWSNYYVGSCGSQSYYRCGWTHYPPNVMEYCSNHDYDWLNTRSVLSDCEDWTPDGTGTKKSVSCRTWNDYLYPTAGYCVDDGGVAFKMWWLQNIPGRNNNILYQGSYLKNWWDFVGDFDTALAQGRSLKK